MSNRVVHFDIHAEDPTRAQNFYESLFGWKFNSWGVPPMEYWVITTGDESSPGINGGLLRRMGPAPAIGAPISAYVCTVEVDSVDEKIEAAIRLGGWLALPKIPAPGLGWIAFVGDTEGNVLELLQRDPEAK